MAKKFGKVLLFTAAASAVAGAALYFLKKKDAPAAPVETEDEDYDDFWEEEGLNIPDEEEVETSAEGTPAEDTPVEEASSVEAPAEEVPAVEAPAADTPAVETPTESEEFFHDAGDATFASDVEKASEVISSFPEENSLNEVFLEDTPDEKKES